MDSAFKFNGIFQEVVTQDEILKTGIIFFLDLKFAPERLMSAKRPYILKKTFFKDVSICTTLGSTTGPCKFCRVIKRTNNTVLGSNSTIFNIFN